MQQFTDELRDSVATGSQPSDQLDI